MKKIILIFAMFVVAFAATAQQMSKKDCYKKVQTIDTTFVNATWVDTSSVMHYGVGYILIDALGLTCLPKVYDTVYSTRLFIVTGFTPEKKYKTKEVDMKAVINVQELKQQK